MVRKRFQGCFHSRSGANCMHALVDICGHSLSESATVLVCQLPYPHCLEGVELRHWWWASCCRKSRDPRFDEMAGTLRDEVCKKRFSFLFDEQLPLEKAELKKAAKVRSSPRTVHICSAEHHKVCVTPATACLGTCFFENACFRLN